VITSEFRHNYLVGQKSHISNLQNFWFHCSVYSTACIPRAMACKQWT